MSTQNEDLQPYAPTKLTVAQRRELRAYLKLSERRPQYARDHLTDAREKGRHNRTDRS